MSFNSDKNDILVHKKHYNFFFRTEHLCEPCGICSKIVSIKIKKCCLWNAFLLTFSSIISKSFYISGKKNSDHYVSSANNRQLNSTR